MTDLIDSVKCSVTITLRDNTKIDISLVKVNKLVKKGDIHYV